MRQDAVFAEKAPQAFLAVILGNGKDEVAEAEARIQFGNDCAVGAGKGDDAEFLQLFRCIHRDELRQAQIRQRRILVEAEDGNFQLPVREIHIVAGKVVRERVDDFIRRNPFRVKDVVDARFAQQPPAVSPEHLFVADTGDDALGAEFLRENGTQQVHFLGDKGENGDVKVRSPGAGLLENAQGAGAALDGLHVRIDGEVCEPFGIAVNDRDGMALGPQELGQVGPHLAGPFNDDFHTF